MDNKQLNFEYIDKVFEECKGENNFNLSKFENILNDEVDNYKRKILNHVEELLLLNIDENDLISKKKLNGQIRELVLKIGIKQN